MAGQYDNPIPTRFLAPPRLFKNSSTELVIEVQLHCADVRSYYNSCVHQQVIVYYHCSATSFFISFYTLMQDFAFVHRSRYQFTFMSDTDEYTTKKYSLHYIC
jgi:hypothetical protein